VGGGVVLTVASLPELWLAGFGVSVLDFFCAFASRIGTWGCFGSAALMPFLGGALFLLGSTLTAGQSVCVVVDPAWPLVMAA